MTYVAGRWNQSQLRADRKAKKRRVLYLIYDTARDSRVRPEHDNWRDIGRPIDDPFWNTHYPPNGWGCRCIARTASEQYLKSRKLDPAPGDLMPEARLEDRINRTTDEIYSDQISGIDTGWIYNVGKASWFQGPSKMRIPELGHEVARQSVASRNFENLFSGEIEGVAPIGYIDPVLSEELQAKTRKVVISSKTLAKQREPHPDLSIEEYQVIPEMIASGLIVQDSNQTILFFRTNGKLYRSAINRTKGGKELILTTFHRTTQRQLAKERRSGRLIREER